MQRTASRVLRWIFRVGEMVVLTVAAARAQSAQLNCGVPLTRHLNPGAVDTYQVNAGPGAVVIDVTDVSGTINLLKLHTSSTDETCSGTLETESTGTLTLGVSDCIGSDTGDYTVTAAVVSDDAGNCGSPAPCGSTPYVRRFAIPGEVDAFTFTADQGDRITFTVGDANGLVVNGVRLRLYDPQGDPVAGGDTCSGVLSVLIAPSGTYTALVSACTQPGVTRYDIAFQAPACPAGPDITYFGVALADGSVVPPADYDENGRPVFRTGRQGFFMVIEAGTGTDHEPVGASAFSSDPSATPDLEVIVSRPLGDGSTAVCDKSLPHQGGVPAVVPFDFSTAQSVVDAINDFGCRVTDGVGAPRGISHSYDACTFFPDGDFHYVNPDSRMQFCAYIANPWSFRQGATVVKARVRDTTGVFGMPREIVVQVGSGCAGDCDGNATVSVNEIVTSVGIALGQSATTRCPAADLNNDGHVTVDELIAAVNVALNGCQ